LLNNVIGSTSTIALFIKQIKMSYAVAEIDINAPNTDSLKFHEKFLFKEVGKQSIVHSKKIVSIQIIEL